MAINMRTMHMVKEEQLKSTHNSNENKQWELYKHPTKKNPHDK